MGRDNYVALGLEICPLAALTKRGAVSLQSALPHCLGKKKHTLPKCMKETNSGALSCGIMGLFVKLAHPQRVRNVHYKNVPLLLSPMCALTTQLPLDIQTLTCKLAHSTPLGNTTLQATQRTEVLN